MSKRPDSAASGRKLAQVALVVMLAASAAGCGCGGFENPFRFQSDHELGACETQPPNGR